MKEFLIIILLFGLALVLVIACPHTRHSSPVPVGIDSVRIDSVVISKAKYDSLMIEKKKRDKEAAIIEGIDEVLDDD
jgi:hypothetical protein